MLGSNPFNFCTKLLTEAYENAVRILDSLRITDAKHRQTILTSAVHVAEVNRYNHDLRNGYDKSQEQRGRPAACAPGFGRGQSSRTYLTGFQIRQHLLTDGCLNHRFPERVGED